MVAFFRGRRKFWLFADIYDNLDRKKLQIIFRGPKTLVLLLVVELLAIACRCFWDNLTIKISCLGWAGWSSPIKRDNCSLMFHEGCCLLIKQAIYQWNTHMEQLIHLFSREMMKCVWNKKLTMTNFFWRKLATWGAPNWALSQEQVVVSWTFPKSL